MSTNDKNNTNKNQSQQKENTPKINKTIKGIFELNNSSNANNKK